MLGRAGGVDALTYGNHPRYTDETLWNYEAGVKTQGRGLTFNAAAFYTRIKNLQVTADAGSCSSRVVFNVPKAHTQGIEAELSARPVRGLDLALSGSIINSKFDSSVTTTAGTSISLARRVTSRSIFWCPRWTPSKFPTVTTPPRGRSTGR